ncbi:MAG: hypothetical protein ACFFCQ_17125 [Promethearchaeota archaeon]
MTVPYIKVQLSPDEKIKWINFAKNETSFGTVSRMVRHAVRIMIQNPDLIAGPEPFFESSSNSDSSETLTKIQSELKWIRNTLEQISIPENTLEDDTFWAP